MLLQGKTAVISGAASKRGIGLATARIFAGQGARVAILDLDLNAAHEAASSLGTGHLALRCDVTDLNACKSAVGSAIEKLGGIDILINNAGITQAVKTMEVDPKSWDRILDVNLRGVLYLSQAVIPHMRSRGRGSIACMSSVSVQRGGGIIGGPHYSAAKAGVLGLAKAMARELGPKNIHVVHLLIDAAVDSEAIHLRMKAAKGIEASDIPPDSLTKTTSIADAYWFAHHQAKDGWTFELDLRPSVEPW